MNSERKDLQKDTSLLSPNVFLTFVMHNEDGSNPGQPDYLNDSTIYYKYRQLVKRLAGMIRANKAALNLQSDWNFLLAVAKYDNKGVMTSTANKNIIQWLHENVGIEMDPHTHEKRYNYADVAYLINQLDVMPTQTVGGFDHTESRWQELVGGINGSK